MGNLKAKEGMQLLNVEGRLRKFAHREKGVKRTRMKDNLYEWKQYMAKSEKHKGILSRKQPDIVLRINECIRQEKEKERVREEDHKKGCWHYNSESGEYYWTGDVEPEHINDLCDSPDFPTKEKIEISKQAQERELELMKQRKHEIEEKRQKRNKERRTQMEQSLSPLPERELCQYELIRADIIREREELMAKFEFMENLKKTKEEIGLYKKADTEIDN